MSSGSTRGAVLGFPQMLSRWRGGRVAEGGGLLNRYRGSTSIVSSNLIPSAKHFPYGLCINWFLTGQSRRGCPARQCTIGEEQ
jgi:hypothetical protein